MSGRIKNSKLYMGWQNYKKTMEGMGFKEKLQHTWFSYKLELGVILMGVFILSVVISCVISANTTLLLAGDVMNVNITDEGMAYLSDEYFESLGVSSFLNKVQVVQSYYSTDEADEYDYNNTIHTQTLALVAADRLDFQMANKQAMEMFISEDIYLDLREIFTEEELSQWKGKIIYCEYEGVKERVPIALDISDMPFIQENVEGDAATFFMVIKHSSRLEETRAYFDYLLAWKPDAA